MNNVALCLENRKVRMEVVNANLLEIRKSFFKLECFRTLKIANPELELRLILHATVPVPN